MPILHTPLCDLLHIALPIVQAPMGRLTTPALAAAVSNAGGLGMLGMSLRTLDDMRQVTRATRALTAHPFGVNFILRPSYRRDEIEAGVNVCLDEGVPVVSFFWDDASQYVDMVHAAGALVMYTVPSAAAARRAVEAGVDIVVAQGWEAGGHVQGEVATLPLVPRVVDAVAPTPVVAAGGIVDGRGMAAALALGAAGVWLGTRFVASAEAGVHPWYKAALLEAAETETILSCLFDIGWPSAPCRTLRNSTVTRWEAAGRPPSGQRPGEGDVVAHWADGRSVVRYATSIPYLGITGDIEAMELCAGQGVGLVTRMQLAGDIVRELAEDATHVLRRCAALVQPAERTTVR
jgi:nitronate monooxygenase